MNEPSGPDSPFEQDRTRASFEPNVVEAKTAEAARRREFPPAGWIGTTYFSEGFPYTIVNNVAEVVVQQLGASLAAIGLTSLLHLPYNLKFLWAPLVDRLGTKRAWVVGTELGLGFGLLALAFVLAPGFSPWLSAASAGGLPPGPSLERLLAVVSALFFTLALLSATSDIAIDGHYLDALDDAGQARFVGGRVLAYKIANFVVRGPLLLLAGWAGLSVGFLAMAGVLLVLALVHALFLPRAARRSGRAVRSASFTLHYAESAKAFLAARGTIVGLVFVIVFRVGESLLQKMKWPFFSREVAMTLADYAIVNGTFGTIASLLSTMLGGFLIARHGLSRWFWPFLLAQNVPNLAYAALAAMAAPSAMGIPLAGAVIFVEEFGSGLGTAVLMVYLMRLCRGEHKAAHFALLTAVMSLGFTLSGAVSGWIAESVGYAPYFVLTFVATAPMMALAPWALRLSESERPRLD